MKYVYSAGSNSFYPYVMENDYRDNGMWPADCVDVSESVFEEFTGVPPDGKCRVPGRGGLPQWGDVPPPTAEELAASAAIMQQSLIAGANSWMNARQWPGKAAIGRLKDDELKSYGRWLDYLDALMATDTTRGPDISWPEKPAS